jgi:hypothetical protein
VLASTMARDSGDIAGALASPSSVAVTRASMGMSAPATERVRPAVKA